MIYMVNSNQHLKAISKNLIPLIRSEKRATLKFLHKLTTTTTTNNNLVIKIAQLFLQNRRAKKLNSQNV